MTGQSVAAKAGGKVAAALVLAALWTPIADSQAPLVNQPGAPSTQPATQPTDGGRGATGNPQVTPPTGTFTLDAEILTRPVENGKITIHLTYSRETDLPTSLHIAASPFGDGSAGVPVTVARGECSAKLAGFTTDLTISNPDVLEALCLAIPPLPPDAKYTGSLTIRSAKSSPVTKRITISPPAAAPAILVLGSQQSDAIKVTLPLWGSRNYKLGTASVTVWEKTKKRAIEGLFVRLDQISKSPGNFGLDNVCFTMDGRPVDLASTAGLPETRRIPAGGPSKIEMGFRNLDPGEYSAIFAFDAANLSPEGAQKFAVSIQARHSYIPAVGVLFLALVVSFFTTRVVVARRRSLQLQDRIRGLSPPWLASFAQAPPAVWIRAMLNQSERLSKRFWLTSPDLIEARVNSVQAVLSVLAEARRTRDRLHDALDFLVFRLVVLSLERIVARIEGGSLDAQTVNAIHTDLIAFDDWLNNDKLPAMLWSRIRPSIERLKDEIGGGTLPAPADQLFALLLNDLNAALTIPPTTAFDTVKAYHKFAKLRILWDVRANPDVLEKCSAVAADLNKFFQLADRSEWIRLKNDARLTLVLPVNSDPRGFEAYDPLQFSVSASDPAHSATFLFRHKVRYRWKFTLISKTLLGTEAELFTLEPETLGPSVVQYFPLPGKVTASVTLEYEADPLSVSGEQSLKIGKSHDFGVFQGLKEMEWVSWSITGGIAMAGGILLLYVKVPGFGSFQDYLNLFLWGVGVDQSKNLAQAFAASSPAPGPASATR